METSLVGRRTRHSKAFQNALVSSPRWHTGKSTTGGEPHAQQTRHMWRSGSTLICFRGLAVSSSLCTPSNVLSLPSYLSLSSLLLPLTTRSHSLCLSTSHRPIGSALSLPAQVCVSDMHMFQSLSVREGRGVLGTQRCTSY